MSGTWPDLASLPRLSCAATGDDAELRQEPPDAAEAGGPAELHQVASVHGLQPAMEMCRELARIFDGRDLVPLRADDEHSALRDRELPVERAGHEVHGVEGTMLAERLLFRCPEMAVEQRRVRDRRERDDGDREGEPRLDRRSERGGEAAEAHPHDANLRVAPVREEPE